MPVPVKGKKLRGFGVMLRTVQGRPARDANLRMRRVLTPTALLSAAGLCCQILIGAPVGAGAAATTGGDKPFKWVSRADALRTDLSLGYEIVYGARVREWLLLQRQQDGRSMFDYIVLPPRLLSQFQDDVNAAVSRGFRLNRGALLYEWDSGGLGGSGLRVGGVLERDRSSSAPSADRSARYEYRLSGLSERAIARLTAEGFMVVDLQEYLDDEGYPISVSLLERRVDTDVPVARSAAAVDRYRLLKDDRALDGRPRAFIEHLRDGYRLGFVAANKAAILLEHDPDRLPRPDYLTIRSRSFSEHRDAEQTVSGLERALNDAASSGYRLLPNRIFHGTSGGRVRSFKEYVAILERVPEPSAVRYVVLPGLTALNDAVAAGTLEDFLIVGTLWSGIVLELPRK